MPWSYAATSNAQRVRVDDFSKIRHRFLPRRRGLSVPAYLARLSSFERSSRKRISSAEKSDISSTLRFLRLNGMGAILPHPLRAASTEAAGSRPPPDPLRP